MFFPMVGPKAMLVVWERRPSASISVAPVAGSIWQLRTFLDDGYEHVGADRNPDLRLHSVLAGSKERFNVQVLLDPLDEQLDLPALTVQVGDQLRPQCNVVCQRRDALARVVLVFASMRGNAARKRVQRPVRHQPRKHDLALMQGGRLRTTAKDQESEVRRSNRHRTKASISVNKSLTYAGSLEIGSLGQFDVGIYMDCHRRRHRRSVPARPGIPAAWAEIPASPARPVGRFVQRNRRIGFSLSWRQGNKRIVNMNMLG